MRTFTDEQIEQAYEASSEAVHAMLESGAIVRLALRLEEERGLTEEATGGLAVTLRDALLGLIPQGELASALQEAGIPFSQVTPILEEAARVIFQPAGIALLATQQPDKITAPVKEAAKVEEKPVVAKAPPVTPVVKPASPAPVPPPAVVAPVAPVAPAPVVTPPPPPAVPAPVVEKPVIAPVSMPVVPPLPVSVPEKPVAPVPVAEKPKAPAAAPGTYAVDPYREPIE